MRFARDFLIYFAASSAVAVVWLTIAHALDLGAFDRGWWAGALSSTILYPVTWGHKSWGAK